MINVKRQTKRSTKFFERFANNINIFYNNFEFAILTTKNWGNFDKPKEEKIEINISGINYEYSLSNFKSLIVQDKKFKAKR